MKSEANDTVKKFNYGELIPIRKGITLALLILSVFYLVTVIQTVSKEQIRDYDNLMQSDVENKMLYLDSLSRNTFENSYSTYGLLDNPISNLTNKVKFGVNQVANPEYLFNYESGGKCGQQSQFIAFVAKNLGLDYRYIDYKFGHVTVEVKDENGNWIFFDPINVFLTNEIDQKTDLSCLSYSCLKESNMLILAQGKTMYKDQLDDFEYRPINEDMFEKLFWFNQITWHTWFIGIPALITVIGISLMRLSKRVE